MFIIDIGSANHAKVSFRNTITLIVGQYPEVTKVFNKALEDNLDNYFKTLGPNATPFPFHKLLR